MNWVSPLNTGADNVVGAGVTVPGSELESVDPLFPDSVDPLFPDSVDPELEDLGFDSTRSLTFMNEAFFFSILEERLLTSVRLGAKQRNRPLMLVPRLKSSSLLAPVLFTLR